jgi:hypothetical protein
LREIFRYTPGASARHDGKNMIGVDNPYAQVNNTDSSDDDFYRTALENSSFQRTASPYSSDSAQHDPWSIKKGSFLDRLNQEHGAGFGLGVPYSDGKTALQGDWSKLPKTAFGTVDKVMPVEKHNMKNLKNPALVYNDPVYGVITPMSNWKSTNEWLGPTLMSVVGAGMGGLMGAAGAGMSGKLGMGAVQGARSLGQGGNPLGILASLGGSAFGLPSWARTPYNMAISQLTKQRKP